ncbi:MAG TPA: GNAT family N-acetyltransferase [Candidatus Cybelea sp.]|jgi:GNAT superfamily N-acetyltransferase|nr:GNAT family N-acetyltransferase [Candidatus Cybelea sp.]
MPGPICTIARAAREDLTALTPLFDAYRGFFAGHPDVARSQQFLDERFAAGDSVIFIARSERDAEGFIQLYPLWSSWHCRRIWFLSDLYVKESSRKHGLGARLVERVVRHAHETGAASIMVELPRREPHLKEFYAKLGFFEDQLFELARYTVEGSSNDAAS